MAAKVRIRLLGGVEISGSDVQLPARALALLGYLVTHPETPQPRGHLADLLWPESSTAQARTNLRRELHHLRGVVAESGCLEVTGSNLTWHEAGGQVDVLQFLGARRAAVASLETGEASFVAESQRALTCYRGAFLPGCYDDWALTTREELQAVCLDLCARAVTFHEQQGDVEAAIALQRRSVGLEPLAEPGYRRLMQLQHAAGDRAGAMRTYHRCASLLEHELGLTPSAQTRGELDDLLSEQSFGSGNGRRAVGSRATTWTASELVGREIEQGQLREIWSAAKHGSTLVLVTGEAGVGKTRLVSDLAQLVRRQDGVVASAGCFAATVTLPLAPVAEWLRHPHLRLSASMLDPLWRAEVERLVPEAGSHTDPVGTERAKVDAWQRLRFFEGLVRAVLAVDRPLLLVVDDLHWCDAATLSWLSFLMSFSTTAPLLVVGTAREGELAPAARGEALAEMEAAGQVRRLALGPLSLEGTAELARGAGQSLSDEELALVQSVTAGNPFYVIEALREAQASPGSIDPADLRGVLTSRLSRLSEPARQVLHLASAVGRDFRLEVLAEASDQDPDTVVEAVDELWRRRILVQREDRYDFAHSLLREAAYDAVPPARRWLLHRRLAQALELVYAHRTDSAAADLAEQYDRSGQAERAVPFYDRAARQAASVFAHADAARLWQRCRELLETLPVGRQREERELMIIQQLIPPLNAWRGYASKELEGIERRAHELGTRLGRDDARATASIALFASTFVQGHIVESNRWAEQALLLVEQFPVLAGQAHMAFAGSALSLGQVTSAAEHFAQACDLAGESDSLPIGSRTEVHARAWWAHARWLLGDAEGALEACDRAELVAVAIDHPYSLAVALSYGAVTHQMRGDLAALERVLHALTVVCDRYEFAYYREWASVLTGWLRGGPEGLALARSGIAALECDGSFARMPYWLSLVADLHRRSGDDAAAAGTLDAAVAVATQNQDVWWLPEVLRARAALGSTPRARAVADLERSVALATEHGSTALLARSRADLVQRRVSSSVPGRSG